MKGGSGSGNFGHAGRKGQLGGSAPAGGGGGTSGADVNRQVSKLGKKGWKDTGLTYSKFHSQLHKAVGNSSSLLDIRKDGKFHVRVYNNKNPKGVYASAANANKTFDDIDVATEWADKTMERYNH